MRRSQALVLDLIISVTILIVAVLLAFNLYVPKTDNLQLRSDASALLTSIFEPFPEYQNKSNIIRPGFVIDHRINYTLVSLFSNLSEQDIKRLVGVSSSYWINVSTDNNTYLFLGIKAPSSATDVYALSRYAALNNTIARVEVGTWH